GHIIPQSILEASIKITNEPPTGMQANLHKAFDNFDQETWKCALRKQSSKAFYSHSAISMQSWLREESLGRR
ncbi:Uncharacterized protein FKW44_024245, partial [Caligus rogercresseyi]